MRKKFSYSLQHTQYGGHVRVLELIDTILPFVVLGTSSPHGGRCFDRQIESLIESGVLVGNHSFQNNSQLILKTFQVLMDSFESNKSTKRGDAFSATAAKVIEKCAQLTRKQQSIVRPSSFAARQSR